ncbi:MAG TPA: hypothetical protein ENG69_05670 [Candidatus Korarchaeota archaeon]|nr:hypothetical protein [Candidatus Korarchaeota archaeon]
MIEEKYCPLLSIGGGPPVRCLGEMCVFYQRIDPGMEGTCAILEGLVALQDLSQMFEEAISLYREALGSEEVRE